MKNGKGGFGSELPEPFGRLLMRDQLNSALYGPLQHLYETGRDAGTDVWIHKNRLAAPALHPSHAPHAFIRCGTQDERAVGPPDRAGPLPAGDRDQHAVLRRRERRSGTPRAIVCVSAVC